MAQVFAPILVVRCLEGKTQVYVDTGMQANPEYGLYNEHTVRIRLDGQKAMSQRWGESTDNEALFAKNGEALAQQLSKANTMIFEFTPFNAGRATAEFNVSGLDQHLGKLKEACSRRGK